MLSQVRILPLLQNIFEEGEMDIPTEQGLYWAKSDTDYRWYNLIVAVVGESPWLSIYYAFNRSEHRTVPVDPKGIIWGPRIEEPKG